MTRRPLLLLFLCTALFACKLLKPTPEKLCAKAKVLFSESGEKAPDNAKCVAELTTMKKSQPAKYECTSQCLQKSADRNALSACLVGCGGKTATSTGSSDDDESKTYPVDELTSSGIKSKVQSKYQNRGYDVMSEKENAAGWVATVAIGQKGGTGEVHIYKVLLADVTSRKDGFRLMDGLKGGGGATSTRVGKKKALYVECLFSRTAYQTGTPKKCSSYDNLIESFTNDLAR